MTERKNTERSTMELLSSDQYGTLALRYRYFLGACILGMIGTTFSAVEGVKHISAQMAVAEASYQRTAHARTYGLPPAEMPPHTNRDIAREKYDRLQQYRAINFHNEVFLPAFQQISLAQLAAQPVLDSLQQIRQLMVPLLAKQPAYVALTAHMQAHPQAYCGSETYYSDAILYREVHDMLLATNEEGQQVIVTEDAYDAIDLVDKYALSPGLLHRFPGASAVFLHRLIRRGQRNGDVRGLLIDAFHSDWRLAGPLWDMDSADRAIFVRTLCSYEGNECRDYYDYIQR